MAQSVGDYEIEIQQVRENGSSTVSVIGNMPEELRMDATSEWDAPFSQGLLGMLGSTISSALRMYGVRPATQLMTLQVWQSTASSDLAFDLVFTTDTDPVKDVQTPVLNLLSMVVPSVDTEGFILSPGPSLDPAKSKQLVTALVSTGVSAVKGFGSLLGSVATGAKNATGSEGSSAVKDKLDSLVDQEGKVASDAGSRGIATRTRAAALKEELTAMVRNRISIQLGRFMLIRDVVVISANPTWSMSYLDAETGLPNMCTVSVVVRPLFAVTVQDLQDMFQIINDEGRGKGIGLYITPPPPNMSFPEQRSGIGRFTNPAPANMSFPGQEPHVEQSSSSTATGLSASNDSLDVMYR